MTRVQVYLIGTGPGAPDLITARGLACLRAADVVLHDHLVHPRLLRQARPGAELIDVGITAPQPLDQDAIAFLVIEKAREGKVVARLKWGDPFVFGMAGEEALFLHEQGIGFEIVPGVPAGIGAAAYAGIPLSHPGGGDTVTLIRGHEDDGRQPPAVDWSSLARLDGSLVCYAGPHQLPAMIDALLRHGRPAGETAALVYNGTAPGQQTVEGTLADIAEAVKQPGHHRAAMLIVGRVVGLRAHARWFDERPLFGRRIAVTRPREQAAELVDRLESLGAETIEVPLIRIEPPDDYGPLDEACRQAGSFGWIVFTSANGVDAFFERLLAGPGDTRDLKGVRLCAIGPATAERLGRFGLKVDLMPTEYRAEAVVEALAAAGPLDGVRVLLPRADIARELLATELRRLGADVTEVKAYRTVALEPGTGDVPDVYRMLLDRQIDVVTFTSASTVRSFVKTIGAEPAADLLQTTLVAAIGPVTADAAAQYNIRTAIMPADYTVPALVDAIVAHYAADRR
ncbi:MAG: uroporphyrinogen-III C-methyltransferase [Acidobacteriota bacterium]|nr:uroporphyrinogen-III C-methyltransferase [Acidobacteriota bacterium]